MEDRAHRILQLALSGKQNVNNESSSVENISSKHYLESQNSDEAMAVRITSPSLLDISYNFVNLQEDTTEMQLNAAAVVSDVPKDIPSSSSSLLINEIKQPPLELNSSTSTIHQDEEDPFEYSGSSFVPSINSSTDNDFEITNEGEDENEKEVMVADHQSKGKKRLRNESTWQRNERKEKRMAGQQYKSSKTKKTIKERKVREPCRNCRLKCNENILGPQRAQIHRQFWNHETTIDQKRQFLCSCLEKMCIKRKRERTGARAGKRHCNWKYFFTIEGKRFQVCSKFFLRTLDISQSFVRCALEKMQTSGVVECDKRGKQPSINKVKNEVKDRIRELIIAYPCEESHYSRRRTAKKYLGGHLNISTMFRMFKEECDLKNIPSDEVSKEWLYNHIFNTEFNLSFAVPSKDTCDTCDEFLINLRQSNSEAERETLQVQYNAHLLGR
ncbi:uncharacterized protein [Diabrotica undecimpunctata]|uniref:uncharacterized protein n=1 Tax=Diabrotica undecimpunctata TaxID=50387 RepID=UPI003B635B92